MTCNRDHNDPLCGTPDRNGWTCCGNPPSCPPTAEPVLNTYLPFGWHLTHLILDTRIWQAIATDDEHVATATGASIELAIASTADNILAESFVGRIFDGISRQREAVQPAI